MDGQPQGICEKETRQEPYVEDLTKEGSNGIRVMIDEADPAPPAMFDNHWVLKVTDESGTPIEGATVEVLPKMPDHNHPIAREAEIEEVAPGVYDANPVNFAMDGYWEVTVNVLENGNLKDRVVFKLCIP